MSAPRQTVATAKPVSAAERAPAKVNLTLRLTGRYADGRHRLASLMGFAEIGDRLDYGADGAWRLSCRGPFAAGLARALSAPEDNLVWRAAQALAAAHKRSLRGRLRLTKNLPLMAGLGGGSSDAAAALRLLARVWGAPASCLPALARRLGADVPAALLGRACFVQGWGEQVAPLRLPRCGLLLVAPPHGLATRTVFDAMRAAQPRLHPPSAALRPPSSFTGLAQLSAFIQEHGNALLAPAQRLYPPLRQLLDALAALQSEAYGMSGSGPACFALFASRAAAERAARQLRRTHADHFITATALGSA